VFGKERNTLKVEASICQTRQIVAFLIFENINSLYNDEFSEPQLLRTLFYEAWPIGHNSKELYLPCWERRGNGKPVPENTGLVFLASRVLEENNTVDGRR